MADDFDWRLQGQGAFLSGVVLQRRRYAQPRPDWDHDHCEFCGVKFMNVDSVDVVREGYATLDGYHWICDTCFGDFRKRFGWTVDKPAAESS